ncbi:hypothetical protein GCM10010425_82700 [Streptomyces spororaveus]|uniref:Uncharacterized protein n=1 Tax=Streptomyces spororaveus TaxID=284039 RepID=A0ABQ3T383_9ACTN|nr:hypothetical protein [Streptomyces spororaveus]GHI74853.1 hypothetical protein Sspor_04140 [Streptomyces spororaveus]
MSEHLFTSDDTSAGLDPDAVGPPRHAHHLRYRSPEGQALQDGLTVVTCACGLTTPALANDDARLVYEEHRNAIRDELA